MIDWLLTICVFHLVSTVEVLSDVSTHVFLNQKLSSWVSKLIAFNVNYHIVHYHKLLSIIYPSAELIKGYVKYCLIPFRITWTHSQPDLMLNFEDNKDSEKNAQVYV